jgi:2-polyprenyl-3-methyl-5-hydroxy-6-metoxy-1,4-benzoquinol methylase
METVVCDLCGADNPRHYLTTTDRFTGSVFNLNICRSCQLVYLSPRPTLTEIEDLYPEDYEAYQPLRTNTSSLVDWHTRRALIKQLKYVEQYRPERGQLLDVGCATGNFLLLARELGWQVFGIEIIEKAAKIAREQLGNSVISHDLETTNLLPGSLDAITLWDVVEHMPSPKYAMHKFHDLLRLGGLVYFSIPNLDSFDRKLFKSEWIGWDAPRHFTLYNESTIQRLLTETGFELVDRRCVLGGKGAFFLSLDRIIHNKPTLEWLRKFYPIISILLWPYRQYAYIRLQGPIIYYAVRKVEA